MRLFITICLSAMLVACAGANYRPLVDMKSVGNQAKYDADLRECQQHAAEVMGAGESAAAGAIVGALLGTAIAAAFGRGASRNQAAAVAAVSGAASGGAAGEMNQREVVKRCLAGRGYSVLH
jgi:outer membrane lipoprotein SlyB